MTSLAHTSTGIYNASAAAGPGTSRSSDMGDGAVRTAHESAGGDELVPPALEPLSPQQLVPGTSQGHAVASEPMEAGPQAPCLDTLLNNDTSPLNPTGKEHEVPAPDPGVLVLPDPATPPHGLCVLYGSDGARWANPAFTPRSWSSYGQATVRMTFRSFQEALGEYWRWANRGVSESKLAQRIRNAVRRRSLRVPECGHKWQVPVHQECGYHLTSHARLMEACDSMTCILCARRTANRRRAALREWCHEREAKRVKGKLSRDFYVLTWTVPKRPWLSVERLQQDASLAFKACKTAWDKHLKYNPKKRGEKHYPGECSDAGMVAFLEVGAGGMVHVTALYYGPWHDAKELRACYQAVVPGGKDFDIRAVGQGKDRRKKIDKAILEACKYVTKGSTGNKDYLSGTAGKLHEYTHPLLCVLAEMALLDRNRVRCYGSMRGVFGKDENDDDDHRAELPEKCPGCGEVHWTRPRDQEDPLAVGKVENVLWEWIEYEEPYAWVPKGWGRPTSAKHPPDG